MTSSTSTNTMTSYSTTQVSTIQHSPIMRSAITRLSSKSSSIDTFTTMMTTPNPPSTSSPVATHLPINPTHGGTEKTRDTSLVLALLVSSCVSALLATLLCCHVCRPQRRHVQERTLGRVQESRLLGQVELEERMVSQAAARAVAIIYREAISCRSEEDQVMYPMYPISLTIVMKVSYIPTNIPDHCPDVTMSRV